MDLKQYCLDAIEKRMLIIAKKLDSMVSNMFINIKINDVTRFAKKGS